MACGSTWPPSMTSGFVGDLMSLKAPGKSSTLMLPPAFSPVVCTHQLVMPPALAADAIAVAQVSMACARPSKSNVAVCPLLVPTCHSGDSGVQCNPLYG